VSSDLSETLKWAVGLPAALAAFLTLPLVFIKYRLECQKLRYELRKLAAEAPLSPASAPKKPGPIFTWMAHYWPIPCYGSMLVFAGWAALYRSPVLAFLAFGTSLMFLISGSAIAERYEKITGRRT
jgi:hypothetical protein